MLTCDIYLRILPALCLIILTSINDGTSIRINKTLIFTKKAYSMKGKALQYGISGGHNEGQKFSRPTQVTRWSPTKHPTHLATSFLCVNMVHLMTLHLGWWSQAFKNITGISVFLVQNIFLLRIFLVLCFIDWGCFFSWSIYSAVCYKR